MKVQAPQQLTGVDIFKFILAFAVIAIHVSNPKYTDGTLPTILQYLVSLAVPFFFIASGFLVARKFEMIQSKEEVSTMFKHRSFQLFRIFGIWLLIYLPITIYHYIETPAPIWKNVASYVYSVLFNGESYLAWPLWFIYSMAIVYLIFSRINLNSNKSLIFLFLLFLLVPLVEWINLNYPMGIIRYINILIHRTIGGGVYILSGIILYRSHSFSKSVITILSIIISILLFVYELPLWQLAGGIAIFNISLSINPSPRKIYLILRNQSMWIYYLHMYPVFTAIVISHVCGFKLQLIPTYIFVSLLTLIITAALGYLINKYPKAHWLTYLIR